MAGDVFAPIRTRSLVAASILTLALILFVAAAGQPPLLALTAADLAPETAARLKVAWTFETNASHVVAFAVQ